MWIKLAASALLAASLAAGQGTPEVRFLNLAPSPYTQRHDAFRAGCGILLSLDRLIREHTLPLRATFHDAVPTLEKPDQAKSLVHGAQVIVIGGSTWAQGSAYYLRRFLELVDAEDLAGTSATAWATAGGAHTGGDVVIADTLRTLMGMGAQVFSLGQKSMVFTTDERFEPRTAGDFSLLDCWYMEQFAKNIALVALAGNDRRKAEELEKKLDFTPLYWNRLPSKEGSLAPRFRDLRDQLNAAADPKSEAYKKLRALLQ